MRTGPDAYVSSRVGRRCTPRVGNAVMAMMTTVGVGVLLNPPAEADPAPNLQEAVVSARESSQCRPLRYDHLAEHAAEIVNGSTYDYISHKTSNIPADGPTDALPILKDLGSRAGKALSLQGAGRNDGAAIKGLLLEGSTKAVFKDLEGRAGISDCSYTDFGVSFRHQVERDLYLVVVVLVGA